jgi:hypothetical protein
LHDCNHHELLLNAAGIAQGLQFPARKGWPAIAVAEALHINQRHLVSFGARRLLRVSWEYQAHISAVAAALTLVVEQLLVDPRSIGAMTPRAGRSKIAASK